jgi:O-antigen/teichoic acid export membrane protein
MQIIGRYWNRSATGVLSVFLAQFAGAGLSFALNAMLARLIGASGVGLYFIVTTIVDIGATTSRLGLENAVLRFSAVAHASRDRITLEALHLKSLALASGAAVTIALPLLLVLSRLPLGGDRQIELRAMLPFAVIAFLPVALRALQAEFFKGTGSVGMGALVHSFLPPLLLFISTVALWWTSTVTFHGVVLAYLAVAFGSAAFALGCWYLRHRRIPTDRHGHFETALLLRTGLPLLFVSFGNLAMNWTDILVLGIYLDPVDVGVYGVARRITILATTFVTAAVGSVTAPRFAALHVKGEYASMKMLARRSTLWMLVATVPLLLLLLVFPEFILGFFGSTFEQGASALRVLALAQLIVISVGPVEYLLIMTGREKLMRNIVMLFAMCNLAGNLLLVPLFGTVGAAISTGACLAGMAVTCLIMVKKHLKFTTWTF